MSAGTRCPICSGALILCASCGHGDREHVTPPASPVRHCRGKGGRCGCDGLDAVPGVAVGSIMICVWCQAHDRVRLQCNWRVRRPRVDWRGSLPEYLARFYYLDFSGPWDTWTIFEPHVFTSQLLATRVRQRYGGELQPTSPTLVYSDAPIDPMTDADAERLAWSLQQRRVARIERVSGSAFRSVCEAVR